MLIRIKEINICEKVWGRLYVEITGICWEMSDFGQKLRVEKEKNMTKADRNQRKVWRGL